MHLPDPEASKERSIVCPYSARSIISDMTKQQKSQQDAAAATSANGLNEARQDDEDKEMDMNIEVGDYKRESVRKTPSRNRSKMSQQQITVNALSISNVSSARKSGRQPRIEQSNEEE